MLIRTVVFLGCLSVSQSFADEKTSAPDPRSDWKEEAPYNYPMTDDCEGSGLRTCFENPIPPKEDVKKFEELIRDRPREADTLREAFSGGSYQWIPDEIYCQMYKCQGASKAYRDAVYKRLFEDNKADLEQADVLERSRASTWVDGKLQGVITMFQRQDPDLPPEFLPESLGVSDPVDSSYDPADPYGTRKWLHPPKTDPATEPIQAAPIKPAWKTKGFESLERCVDSNKGMFSPCI